MAEPAAADAELQDAYGFSKEQLANFREAFNQFDKDGDGRVSVKELRNVFIKMGLELSEDHCAKLVELVDVAGTGSMRLSEFCILVAKTGLVESNPDAELRAVFDSFDVDSSDQISPSELQELLSKLGEDLSKEDVQHIFREAGCAESGAMTFVHFKDLMKGAVV